MTEQPESSQYPVGRQYLDGSVCCSGRPTSTLPDVELVVKKAGCYPVPITKRP